MPNSPIISFCIPTYNRSVKVFQLVSSILKYKGNNIEVLVLDNCSTDNTIELLEKITDSRFSLIQNEKNIGGIKNPYKALSLANGEFCILCLDKDFLNYELIDELIASLEKDKDVVFGHCVLDNENNGEKVIFKKGFESIYNMAYLSAHPSGMFYKKDIFVKTQALSDVFETDEIFGFQFELINAEMALTGKSLLINLPIFSTETKEESGATTSFTYKNADDVFFAPKKQLKTFHIYFEHLYSLDLLNKEKSMIMRKILEQFLLSSTLGYRQIMIDEYVCRHYNLEQQKISIIKLLKLYFNFLISFLKSDFQMPILNKLSLFFSVSLNMIFSIFKNKISLNNGK